jgi:hypothetical protein
MVMGQRLDENATLKNLIFIGVNCDTIKHQLWLSSGSYMTLGWGRKGRLLEKKEAQTFCLRNFGCHEEPHGKKIPFMYSFSGNI